MSTRSLTDVIQQMLEVIPSSEEELIIDLEYCLSSAQYSAPELMGLRWEHTAQVLYDRFGDDDFTESWQHELMRIWNPDYED